LLDRLIADPRHRVEVFRWQQRRPPSLDLPLCRLLYVAERTQALRVSGLIGVVERDGSLTRELTTQLVDTCAVPSQNLGMLAGPISRLAGVGLEIEE
jgi:hypothetical protein